MPALLTALAAGSLALAPPGDNRARNSHGSPAAPTPVALTQAKDCARQLDPSFVHFVACFMTPLPTRNDDRP